MPPVPDSSSTPPPAAIATVEAGLAAFKQGDYHQAIALLENHPLPFDHPLSLKATMGLVVAYSRTGDGLRAVTLCQSLINSQNPQVQEWAARTQASLAKRHSAAAESVQSNTRAESDDLEADLTGFVPSLPPQPSPDSTGFVPLDAASLPAEREPTGFVPLNSPPASTRRSQPQLPEVTPPHPEVEPASSQPTPASESRSKTNPLPRSTPNLAPKESPPTAPTPGSLLPVAPFQPNWKNAGRAERRKPLGKIKIEGFLFAQLFTLVSLVWVITQLLYRVPLIYHNILIKLPLIDHRYTMFDPPLLFVGVLLTIGFITSRWLLDALLRVAYGLEPLSRIELTKFSPETGRSLQRFCQQRRIPVPALGILPISAPLAFSYGCLPRFTRTVVSKGLLEQLADDEIAAVYASEMGHISFRSVPLLSLVMVVLQVPYTLYWLAAEFGNREAGLVQAKPFDKKGRKTLLNLDRSVWWRSLLLNLVQVLTTVAAAISYGVYVLLRYLGLWLSRQRVYLSDRVAAELTGNPNGWTRALLKLAIGTARDVEARGRSLYALEGFDLLTPIGYRQATSLGSLFPHAPLESLLAWDGKNPFRGWLCLNNSHPPTGDRLHLLSLYARHWGLDTELDFGSKPTTVKRKQSGFTGRQWRSLLMQGAPFFGLGFGLLLAFLLSLMGWVGTRLQIGQLSWLQGDLTTLVGLPLVGFGLGTFLRINPFFPDIKISSLQSGPPPTLPELLADTEALPITSTPIRLEGTLLGREAMSNYLSQDLLLQTAQGIVRLHCLSFLGPIGNLLPTEVHPTELINQKLVVTGWFRRGVVPWIDVETLRTPGGRISRSYHPIWSTLIASLLTVWALLIIARGQFL